MKSIYLLLVLFLFLIIISSQNNKIFAQTCTGSYTGGNIITVCTNISGDICALGSSGCTCHQECQDDGISRSCSNYNSNQTACLACHAALGSCCGSLNCAWSGGGSSSSLCGGGPVSYCSFGGGYFCCGTNMTCVGSPSNFYCVPSTPTPTPTPPPTTTQICTPNEFISGTYCTSSTTCYDLYCNSTGTGTVTRDYSGSTCSFCANPTPTSGSGSTPPPTSGGGSCDPVCGCGSHADSSLCGGCCPNGTSCQSTFFGGYECVDSGGGGGSGGCPAGQIQTSACVSNSCQAAGCGYITFCSSNLDCTCGNGVCDAGETYSNCPADCSYTISGKVFIDANNNGIQDCSGACDNGAGDELNYSGATLTRSSGGGSRITDYFGNYSFTYVPAGAYTITLTLPANYVMSGGVGNSNPRSVTVGPSRTNVNFGIRRQPPACSPSAIANSGSSTVNPGASTTLSVSTCTDVENPNDGSPPPPFSWNPDAGGSIPPPTISGQTDTSTSSTVNWIAPSCPPSQTTYTPQVTVSGPGGSTTYSTSITVPATYQVTANVRSVTDATSCTPTSGVVYSASGTGANLNLNGGSVNQNRTTNPATGQAIFTCIPGGNYQLTLSIPSGYTLTGINVNGFQSLPGNNPINLNSLSGNTTTTFCIAQKNPWFQTDKGDIRFLNLINPIPLGQYGSTDITYPGIYYSSNSNVNVGFGTVSSKNWAINNEYSYNADTQNRNGSMSYDFYKARASQLGTTITQIDANIFDQSQITGSGVYEAPGDLTINLYTHVNGRRVVLLVNGNVTINAPIYIPQNQGVFILAAKGNIRIAKTVGVNYNTNYVLTAANTHSLDGYYTAQGSIIIDGDTCPDGTTSDLRLNVGGALIANSLKPFSTTGTGTIQNKRSLCANSATYPSLFVASRPDFLTQLTDFYKTSYSKWQEVKP